MSLEDAKRLRQLETEVAQLRPRVEAFQRACPHDWGDPIYDPYTVKVGYGLHIDRETSHGSDPNYAYEGYSDETKPRWYRECKKCLLRQVTEQQGTATVKTGPKF